MAKTAKSLTPKQLRFVDEYLKDLNGTQAALRSGFGKNAASAAVLANGLLRNVKVATLVAERQAKRAEKAGLTAERVLEEVRRLALFDIRTLFDDKGQLKPVHEWPDEAAAAVGGIDITRERKISAQGEDLTYESTAKVKTNNKSQNLEMLMKHFGLLTEKVEHSGEVVYKWQE